MKKVMTKSSKNNSSESRTIQEFKIESRRRKSRVKNQDSRFKISRIKIKIQDSRFKNQEKA